MSRPPSELRSKQLTFLARFMVGRIDEGCKVLRPRARQVRAWRCGRFLQRLARTAHTTLLPEPVTSRSRLGVAERTLQMLAVVVPAHDEQDHIGACLASLNVAARCSRLEIEEVLIVVAADTCGDQTVPIARSLGASVVSVDARNVGVARAAGARLALDAGARWLAFTDADSVVAPDWLSTQLEQRCDAVCGTIEVRDWESYGDHMREQHLRTYTDADGHRHVHGANLGVAAFAYKSVGGFKPLVSSEDVALVEALSESGASIAWSAAPRVVTSARRAFRAPRGFGELLARLDRELTQTFGAAGAAL